MDIRVICSFLVIFIIQESLQIELDEVKAENPSNKKLKSKRVKTKPYGKTLMEDTPKEFTLQGYLRKKEAVAEMMKMASHKTRREMKMQNEEEDCLEYYQQCRAAELAGIDDKKVLYPQECIEFREKYNVPLEHSYPHKRRKKRFVQGTGGIADTLRWDKCIVPYNMAQIPVENDVWERIRAHRKFEYWTSFKFVEWNSSVPALFELTHSNYLIHVKSSGCWSFVGNLRAKQGQEISACGGVTAQHEIGHALGGHHSQANPIRDHFIKVNMDYILPSWRNQYTKKSMHHTDQWFHYDFGSILHYGIYSSGNQGLQTMAPYDLIHMYELINTDLYSFYLHKSLEAVHGCAGICPDRTCENEGFMSQLGYDNKCGCRCCEGLDPETNCTTIYRGSNEGAEVQWPGGTYSILKAIDQPCPLGFNSGSVTQYIDWDVSTDSSFPFHYDLVDGANDITHKFCTKTSSSGPSFPKGQYCLLKHGNCPPEFVSGFAQFEDTQAPVTQGTVPDGNYTTHTRLDFCCRQDGNYDDEIVFPYSDSFILFQQSSSGCQQVKDMAVISESIIMNNITVQNTMEFGGWLPRMVKYYKGTKYEFFFCYYHKLNYDDCGDIIELTEQNPTATILSPNYPLPYPNYKRCHWMIKSPVDSQILVHLHEYEIEDTISGSCADFIDVRYYGCGSSGKYMCGTRINYGIRSLHNLVTIIFGSDYSIGMKGFNATVSIVTSGELRYKPNDYGESYRGKVNFTRSFKPCLHWADVSHCEHHPFNKFDINKHLEENYCRSPGSGTEPWCYYEASQCMVDTCDVSLIEPCYDISTQCDEIQCTDEEASRVCNKKCSCNANNDAIRGPPVQDVKCSRPASMGKEATTTSKKSEYFVGETIRYDCKSGVDFNYITCMTDGEWSTLNYVCHSCPKNWVPYKDACYRLFNTYMMKEESKQYCKSFGSEIVSIRSLEEQLFIDKMRDGQNQAWIGILYSLQNGIDTWTWEDDGATATYTNFTYGRKLGCAYMSKSGTWHGVTCDSITFKGVICKINLSERTGCIDQRNDCKRLTERKPTACVDFEEFRNYECPFTCGVCAPRNADVATCLRPDVVGNFTLEVGNYESITVGNVFGYRCLENYHLVEGDLFRICHTDGTLSGSTPICKMIPDMEWLVNPMPIVRRRWVGSAYKAYFGLNEQHLIPRDGILVEWKFYSLFPGQVTFQVWENTTTANYYNLVGRTMLSSTGDGRVQRLSLTGSARINVKKGQYIGIHYPNARAGITYDTCSLTLTGPYDNQLISRLGQYYKGGFKVGQQYEFQKPGMHNVCKVFSFTAIII